MPDPDPGSIAERMRSFDWSSDEAIAYEAAVEAINGAVGASSARIAAEEAAPAPDDAHLVSLLEGQARCATAREQLDPSDHAAVAEARRRFTDLAHAVRAEGP